jgi:hypothetical protein
MITNVIFGLDSLQDMEWSSGPHVETRGRPWIKEGFNRMIEVPSWFLVVVGVAMFAMAHRRRRGTVLLYDMNTDIF